MPSQPSIQFDNITIQWIKYFLLQHGVSNASKEVDWFIRYTFNIQKHLLIDQEFIFNKTQKYILKDFMQRRISQEPFQYILGTAPFYGRDFIVNKDVLIPRPETEIIIDILLQKEKFDNALDVGTGSGNLAIILKLENIANHITGIDISVPALNIANQNMHRFNIKDIHFICHDFLNKDLSKKYDLIVSNPPYISHLDYKNLEPHIKNYEPAIALTDYSDGLIFYKRFAMVLKNILNPEGMLLLEVGIESTQNSIDSIFKKYHFQTIWHKDYNNNYRIVQIGYE